MNFNVTSASPAFKAIYVVEGKRTDVNNYFENELEKTDLSTSTRKTDGKYIYDANYCKDGNNRALIATEEDVEVFWKWQHKYGPHTIRNVTKQYIETMAKQAPKADDLYAYYDETRKILEYGDKYYKRKRAERSNLEVTLKQLKEFTSKKIEIFNINDLKKSISEGKFHPIKGRL